MMKMPILPRHHIPRDRSTSPAQIAKMLPAASFIRQVVPEPLFHAKY